MNEFESEKSVKSEDYLSRSENVIEDISSKEMENTTNVEDKVEEPKVGMLFDSTDELMEYYRMYGKKIGFEISKRTSSKGDDGELKYITLAWSRNGKSKCNTSNPLRLHPVTKTDCQARLRAAICSDGKWWCLWHIINKLPKKLRGYKQYEAIEFALQNVVYDSLTQDEFEDRWNRFITMYYLHANEWLSGLYNERRRWVPTFVKDTFWAGMSTTQRNESMHAFFDGYVNSKTSLKQFVEQYINALKDKVEKENHEDFNSFNSLVPCITRYDIEKPYQSVYTTTKFKEFQEELAGKIYCELVSRKEIAEKSYEFVVDEDVIIGEISRRISFLLCFNEEKYEVTCNCQLFEFRGILCRHAIVVLIHKKINCIPDMYILRRWRKDVKRCHTRMKIIYVDYSVKLEACRFDKMCNSFYKVADLATDSDDRCNLVMNMIYDLKMNLTLNECTYMHDETISGGEHNDVSNKGGKVLTQLVVQSNGHPPF